MASIAPTLRKFFSSRTSGIDIDIIYWESSLASSTRSLPSEYLKFRSEKLSESIKQIMELRSQYDLFLCYNWRSAIVCYVANVNFIYHGTGSDIRNLQRCVPIRSRIENFFYKLTLRSAIMVLVGDNSLMEIAKKYNGNVRFDKVPLDTILFCPDGQQISMHNGKFVFLCPQRMEWDKGYDILWQAIELAKSDFVVLQCNWGREPDYSQIISKCPKKIELIPLIKREQMAHYYRSVDAVLGGFKLGTLSSIEREAAACRKPVLVYSTHYRPEQQHHPFLQTNDPLSIAEAIDKLVEDPQFREQLEEKQYSFILQNYGITNCLSGWREIFDDAMTIRRKKSHRRITLKILNLVEKYTRLTNVPSSKLVVQKNDNSLL